MIRSTVFDHLPNIEAAAEAVTEGTAMCSSEQLAGQWAFDAAKDAGCGFDAAYLEAHLDFLRDAGARFEPTQALQVAQQFAAEA